MSMTREEAIEIFEQKGWWIAQKETLTSKQAEEIIKLNNAVNFALSALRPVSRERVERMRGEWISTGAISCKCSRCNHLEPKYRVDEYNCCPYCMAPMTDAAVEMVMERMETVYGQASD